MDPATFFVFAIVFNIVVSIGTWFLLGKSRGIDISWSIFFSIVFTFVGTMIIFLATPKKRKLNNNSSWPLILVVIGILLIGVGFFGVQPSIDSLPKNSYYGTINNYYAMIGSQYELVKWSIISLGIGFIGLARFISIEYPSSS